MGDQDLGKGHQGGHWCDEHWVLHTNDNLWIATSETNGLLYAGKLNSNF